MNTKTADVAPGGLILVVDDSMDNVQLLRHILKDEFDVVFARNGQKAMQIVADQAPDLILLDAVMPDMDGFAVCTAVRALSSGKDIPVIFVTSLDQPEDETKALDLGAVDFISKPVNAAVLRARIRTHLTLKRQADLLRNLSLTDGLTGIANRRRFDETFLREWRRCERAGLSIALVMIDIDHFKAYNDHYGHQGGDDCLRAVAQTLTKCLNRPADLLARYGGEEFVALLPGQNGEEAAALARKMQRALADRAIPHAASPVAPCVTLSQGVAATVARKGDDPAALLGLADQCLYKAKENGRDRVFGGGAGRFGGDVLVIEDDSTTAALLSAILAGAGYSVRTAGDGEAGLAEARRKCPNIILLDIGLPGPSGFHIAEMLRADTATCQIPVVAVTARSSWTDYDAAFASGFNAYVEKPIDAVALLGAVQDLLVPPVTRSET